MYIGNNHPSDIDLYYIGNDEGMQMLILGEIKNEKGTLGDGQRLLYERLVNNWYGSAMILFIKHDKCVQYGDDIVDVGDCYVDEYYYKKVGKWVKPRNKTSVKEVIERYS